MRGAEFDLVSRERLLDFVAWHAIRVAPASGGWAFGAPSAFCCEQMRSLIWRPQSWLCLQLRQLLQLKQVPRVEQT